MYCDWGSGWHDSPYYHGGLAALLILVCLLGIAAIVFCYTRRKRSLQPRCPACGGSVEDVYLRCPFCGTALKRHCSSCHRIIGADFPFCPFCRAAAAGEDRGATQQGATPDVAPSTNTGRKG
ncbi:MAG TPA: hypothetical protein ENI89_04490 [Desulfobulbus sp.]|nr:hypothetical protein [Desulfobulbus sp.]